MEAFGFGIIFGLLFAGITAQNGCSNECVTCDINTGSTCTKCVAGYYGSNCENVCQPGYYVFNNHECLKCENPGCTCSSKSSCDACLEGYYKSNSTCNKCPKNCKTCERSDYCTSCAHGYYGSYCQFQCSQCVNGDCDSEATVCRCVYYAFVGTHCADCYEGRYGSHCHIGCSSGCIGGKCNGQMGACSCKIGWTGSKCDLCAGGYYGSDCSPIPSG